MLSKTVHHFSLSVKVEVCKDKITAEDEMKKSFRHLAADVLMVKVEACSKLRFHPILFIPLIKGLGYPVCGEVFYAAEFIAANSRPLQ